MSNIYDEIIKSPVRILPITFLLLCVLGGILLYLPCSGTMSFIDALFTSVSGVCVTGLSVQDISVELNLFGQFMLMLLIQAGGLGIMTISSVIFLILGKKCLLHTKKTPGVCLMQKAEKKLKILYF